MATDSHSTTHLADELIDWFLAFLKGRPGREIEEIKAFIEREFPIGAPMPTPTRTEKLARAYRDLEGAVMDLEMQRCVFDEVFESTMAFRQDGLVADLKRRAPMAEGFQVYMLTKDQDNALRYAFSHFAGLVQDLKQQWSEGLEAANDSKPT